MPTPKVSERNDLYGVTRKSFEKYLYIYDFSYRVDIDDPREWHNFKIMVVNYHIVQLTYCNNYCSRSIFYFTQWKNYPTIEDLPKIYNCTNSKNLLLGFETGIGVPIHVFVGPQGINS